MRSRLVPLTLLGMLALAVAAPSAWAQYPPPGGGTTVSDTTVVPGESLSLTSPGWEPGSTADIDFLSTPVDVGQASANSQGVISTSVDIPEDAAPGEHFIRLTGTGEDGDPRQVRTRVVVVAAGSAAAGAGASEVAFTGANIATWMVIGVALLTLGTFALVISRRRVASVTRP
jgi:hypothetical protein